MKDDAWNINPDSFLYTHLIIYMLIMDLIINQEGLGAVFLFFT